MSPFLQQISDIFANLFALASDIICQSELFWLRRPLLWTDIPNTLWQYLKLLCPFVNVICSCYSDRMLIVLSNGFTSKFQAFSKKLFVENRLKFYKWSSNVDSSSIFPFLIFSCHDLLLFSCHNFLLFSCTWRLRKLSFSKIPICKYGGFIRNFRFRLPFLSEMENHQGQFNLIYCCSK